MESLELNVDTIEWVELPKGRAGRKPVGPPRRSIATLHRASHLEVLRVERSLFTSIGSPTHVEVLLDKGRCRIALRPVEHGGRNVHVIPQRNHSEVNVAGTSRMLELAGNHAPVPLRAAIRDGMILLEPIAPPVPCAACGGKGVER